MKRGMVVALIIFSAASLAAAQEKDDNVLTPTDVLEAAQISLTAALRIGLGGAEVGDAAGTWDLDVDQETFDLIFAAGIGLGRGFEIEASIPYEIKGVIGAASGGGEYGADSYSVGGLTLHGVYRLLKGEKETPQWVVSAIVVAPTGYWKEAEAEITIGGTTIVEGDKGGIGEGVWRYGLGTAISKRFGAFEPYVGLSYLFGGDAERKDTEYERPNIGQVFLGAEFHVSPEATIDVRGEVQFVDEEVEQDKLTGAESTEENYQAYVLVAQLYARVGPGVTLLLGGGIFTVQDHLLSEEGNLELEGHLSFVLQVGLHLVLGGK